MLKHNIFKYLIKIIFELFFFLILYFNLYLLFNLENIYINKKSLNANFLT
jgi:hypothetical protein